MKDTDIPPLTDEMARLLRAEARRPARPAAEGDVILARVARSLAGGGTGGSGDGDTGPPAPPTPGPAGGGALRAATHGLPRSLAIAAVSFLLGGGAGGSLVAYLRASPPPSITMGPPVTMGDTPNPPAAPYPSPPPAPAEPALIAPVERAGGSRGVVPSELAIDAGTAAPAPRAAPKPVEAADASAKSTLAEERAILEGAREALKRGDTDAALGRLSLHARRYADGQLVEEREALRVHALAASPRAGEARDAARAFRERFPNSVFSPDLGIDGGG